jgi:glycine/D-amino acid oxidase-like deaminating enzyme
LIENAPVQELLFSGDACVGVLLRDGRRIESDHVVVAAGAWTSKLYPELSAAVRPTGHPVFHLRPKTASLFESIRFPTFTADVARTGYYGFPLNRDGVVKIGVHGVGIDIDPDATRTVAAEQVAHMRQFLGIAFPDLVDAELVYTRLCLYTDTPGEDFVIDSHPNLRGVTVSSGGSGHGFKFGPVLGALTADAVEGKPPRYGQKFSWLRFVAGNQPPAGAEAARCHDPIDLVH